MTLCPCCQRPSTPTPWLPLHAAMPSLTGNFFTRLFACCGVSEQRTKLPGETWVPGPVEVESARRSQFFKLWRVARARVAEEINIRARSGGMYARGLASEGYHAGYLQAMDDIDAVLRHGCPSDPHRFWAPGPVEVES